MHIVQKKFKEHLDLPIIEYSYYIYAYNTIQYSNIHVTFLSY